VVLELGQNYGICAEVMTFALTFPAGLSFMLPMGTPATAIAYSSGFFRPIEMIRAGLLIVFCSWILFVLTAMYWWPLLGYQIG
jgi:solute carrier family 13 (sodium-dependent dicarboxylate transporter), member 2/3/5